MPLPRPRPTSLAALALVITASLGIVASSSAATSASASEVTGPGDRAIAFRETFAGDELDGEKWLPCYPWWNGEGCEHLVNGELQWYVPRQDHVRDGMLRVVAKPERVLGEDEQGDPMWFDYVSGMVTTAERFEFTYGYVEIEARVPAGQGLWPALWLLTAPCCDPEIDMMENLGHQPRTMYFTYHHRYGEAVGTRVRGVERGWHTYAIDWRPDQVVWYLDGDEVFRTDRAPHRPMYLLMNLAVGGEWPGDPDETTRFPARFDVRSVTVWQ